MRRLLRHDYPITLGVFGSLGETRPDVVVVSGWSTFASQAAVLWCRLRDVPYVLLVESNDRDPRPGWRRLVKRLVVPPIVRRAARILAIGTLARESVLARGARPEDVRWFANTVDVPAFFERADRLAPRRADLRAAIGAGDDDVVVLSVARLAPEKGLDTLVAGAAAAGDPRLLVVVAGEGHEREKLAALARSRGVRLELLGDLQPWERVFELYAAADVFALLSTHEPWGVVVNEAAAFGLPLVLSDRVGAAYDLLVDGENGALVPAGDAAATGAALGRLASDRRASPSRRRPLARADEGLGLRAEHRELRRHGARGGSLVDLLLQVDTRSQELRRAAATPPFASAAPQAVVGEHPLDRRHDRVALVRDDERLAVAERGGDRRSGRRRRQAFRPRPPPRRPFRSSRPPRPARAHRPPGRGRAAVRRSAAAGGRGPRWPGRPVRP